MPICLVAFRAVGFGEFFSRATFASSIQRAMKRFTLYLSAAALLLTACGGDSGAVSCANDYWDGTYGTCLPEDWAIVNAETLRQRGVPEDTLVAFQSEVPVSGQFPTVVVTREPLATVVTPEAYSEASIRSVATLPNYAQIDERDVRLDDTSLKMTIFTAQPTADEPLRRFYQISTVAGGVGYTITGTTPVSPGDSLDEQIQLIIRESTFAGGDEEE